MADNIQGYKYSDMSNKVLRTDRRLMDKGGNLERNINTNPQSLVGKIGIKEIGSKVDNIHTASSKRSREEIDSNYIDENKKRQRKSITTTRRHTAQTILDSQSLETFNYTPTDATNNTSFEKILNWANQVVDSDVPHDVVRSFADVLLEIMKNENLTDLAKKKQVEDAIDVKLSNESFQTITDLVKDITDYDKQGNPQSDSENEEHESNVMGLAIDEEDDETSEDESEMGNDEDQESDDGELNENMQNLGESENVVQLANEVDDSNDDDTISKQQGLLITEIDQFWLTRQISVEIPNLESYEHTELASKVMNNLEDLNSNIITVREFEHNLIDLLPDDAGNLTQTILKYRFKILFVEKRNNSSKV
ncbi:unnamed protein product [Ambrosiozyma monospora]|uniref:Unnamed protein product n=1 Tax=Ambrosiozyma monospora TaxID=43982 RepID=A0ACB5T3K6_AMBMO|nr:unnamed protein product [Ambrosiozyma monospora]